MTLIKRIIKSILLRIRPIQVKGVKNVIIQCPKTIGQCNIFVNGNNNLIDIDPSVELGDVKIFISGDNNKLIIDSKARLIGPCVIYLDGNGTLHLGENCGVRGVEFSIKGGNVQVGKLVMFSYGIKIRNHDSHKVYNAGEIVQVNPPKDIIIGDHVWICQNASILKGVCIGNNSIVAYGCVATRSCTSGCILAGNPSKIVKQNITWDY